jgi:hypothetical protein
MPWRRTTARNNSKEPWASSCSWMAQGTRPVASSIPPTKLRYGPCPFQPIVAAAIDLEQHARPWISVAPVPIPGYNKPVSGP